MSRILIVDDDPNILSGLRRHFARKFDVDFANSAERALGMLSDGPDYAVILSDQTMPGMDGLTLLGRVQAQYPLIIRMMLTGTPDVFMNHHEIAAGALFRYLRKPCEISVIDAALRDALECYKQQLC